jgi:hypothetical protein
MIVAMDPLTFEQKDLRTLWAAFPHFTSEELAAKHAIQGSAVGPAQAISRSPEGQPQGVMWQRPPSPLFSPLLGHRPHGAPSGALKTYRFPHND